MKQEREENGKLLLAVAVSSEKVPEISLRDKIRQLVNKYASATNTRQQGVACMKVIRAFRDFSRSGLEEEEEFVKKLIKISNMLN